MARGSDAALHLAQVAEPRLALPVHARRELTRDYNAIVYADDGMKAREAYQTLAKRWRSCVSWRETQ